MSAAHAFPRRLAAGALAVLSLGTAQNAAAFCRTTTCDPKEDPCRYDANECETTGKALHWRSGCVSFGVQKDGSPLREISYDEANSIIERAFGRWTSASCPGGGQPSIEVADLGAIQCSEPEYNTGAANANVWMFRDADWPYKDPTSVGGPVDAASLAVTAITFDPDSGAIYDADVEINSENVPFSLPDEEPTYDLESIVSHEAGHFLGLHHSLDTSATMYEGYVFGDVGMRTLAPDDEAGLCAIYPPDREPKSNSCTPRHGFSSECATDESGCCSTAPGRPTPQGARGPWLMALMTALCGGVAWRRRTRRA